MEVDHIVVGAGAAGCVAARRLAEAGHTTLLLEAGGAARDPRLRVPKAFVSTLQRERLTWRFTTAHRDATGAPETWVRGRVVGGSTAINGMLHLRGDPSDWDELAAIAGDERWGWTAMQGVFAALEDRRGPRSPRSERGPLPITFPAPADPVCRALLAAAARRGVAPVPDVDGATGDRVGPPPSTVRRGRRVSAADAFLRGAPRRLRLVTGVTAERLLLTGDRVVGVQVRTRQGVVEHRARGEVLVCTGTVASPLLLERSGIGHPDVLRAAGLRVRVPSPRVGAGLREHRCVRVEVALRAGLGHQPGLSSRPRRALAILRYLLTRRGIVATGPYDLVALTGSGPASGRPDLLLLATPLVTDASGLAVGPHPGLTVVAYALRPTSEGSVHVTGPGLEDPPAVVPAVLTTTADRRATHAALEVVRGWLAEPPVAAMLGGELRPGRSVGSEQEVVDYARSTGAGVYHAVGTCAMGTDPGSVVDGQLRVRGVRGLRVADASVLPTMVAGATAGPTTAVGWRAADLVAGG